MERPLILHVPRRFAAQAWGGTERLLQETIGELGRRGVDGRVATSRVLDATPRAIVNGVEVERHPHMYPVWPLSARRRAEMDRKGGNLVSFGVADAIRRAERLALVHLHTGNRLGAQALRAARARRVPCVLSLHGGWFAMPEAERADLGGARTGGRGIEWGRVLGLWWKARDLLRDVDAVICVGREEFELASQRLPAQRVRFLPGGVDVAGFANADRARGRATLGVAPHRELVVAISRLDRQKDLATLVRAWARAARPRCDLALVGPETSPGYADELRRDAAGAPGRLILSGNVAAAEIPHLLAAGDLAALPSRHEPFGLACLEAWATGTCLVAARVGGPAWLLAGETCGRLFPPGDEARLAALIGELLDDPAQRRRLADAGRARASGEFTWKHHVDTLLAIYREVGFAPRHDPVADRDR